VQPAKDVRTERLRRHFVCYSGMESLLNSSEMLEVSRMLFAGKAALPNKPLVPTRTGEAPVLAARRRWAR